MRKYHSYDQEVFSQDERRFQFCARSDLRAADGELIQQHGRLADADGHALAVLAAGADAGVEGHVVADHGNAGERVGAVANQRRALDRGADLAVLDQVGLGAGKDELARRNIDLAAAEIGGVEALLTDLMISSGSLSPSSMMVLVMRGIGAWA